MKSLFPIALLALAALSPAPILDPRPSKPVPERSEKQVLAEMRFTGAYKPVGRIQEKSSKTELRDAPARSDSRSLANANAVVNQSDDTLARASAQLREEPKASGGLKWILIALAAGGAFGIVRGLRAWADKALPAPRR